MRFSSHLAVAAEASAAVVNIRPHMVVFSYEGLLRFFPDFRRAYYSTVNEMSSMVIESPFMKFVEPVVSVNSSEPVIISVEEMVADYEDMIVNIDKPVKVPEYKEPREPGVPAPKRIRHPRIQISIIFRWSIIRNWWWSFIGIVAVEIRVVRICRGLSAVCNPV